MPALPAITHTAVPRLAAFPKAYMQALVKDGSMKLAEWIDLASTLGIDGLEWYAGFLEMADESAWPGFRRAVEARGMVIPMLCCSPDFTHPDPAFREREIEKQKTWIRMAHALGAGWCRTLSGQRRPELTPEQGVALAAESIRACLALARELGVTLIAVARRDDPVRHALCWAEEEGAVFRARVE